ncbi:2,4-dienoyl-CoA reductase [Thecamonas trahens ATCC 50062]|uniref:2,4-dienoyl-CoA reductase n=1 Tax=Thecamonas trahens ATCC 50062 TaxID=461836 RepID=A0A0L0DME0_THETB|nr:2,4-dienoyl-CoA reductase [Thecamonas trahens ATCC 50062]KNC53477.1 2,4-dienoyl-CoA reductase [Thecamonas trahens ATCC 50062]|eukprot:XP_013761801.1 2,4-dienoyl-CoA reductase [Thecamonas trahens ATCC 50062]
MLRAGAWTQACRVGAQAWASAASGGARGLARASTGGGKVAGVSKDEYPLLMSPLKAGNTVLKNRVLMGSMHTGLEEEDGGFEKLAAYFAARAAGGVGTMVTGGVSCNRAGWVKPFAAKLTNAREMEPHKLITSAVHDAAADSKIVMQILHAGRYSYSPIAVAPSRIKSPISPFSPWALTKRGVRNTIADFAATAALAKEAGYDGVEIMGSEGYLINEFISAATNKRSDEYGGEYANRIRFPLDIVDAVRQAVGSDFLIIFRLSMLDLVSGGSVWPEVVELAVKLEERGVDIINTGIGWHEARIPTIATLVPRGSFSWVTGKLKGEVGIPLVATNRINMPHVAERILAAGEADMISMARPLLADPDWVNKAAAGEPETINTCIGCNQACLDHVFSQERATCLVNPLAAYETERKIKPLAADAPRKHVAIVGSGPAGLAAATVAAQRGHDVSLFDGADALGGQFNLAKRVPGKEEFVETIRYYSTMARKHGVRIHLGTRIGGVDDLNAHLPEGASRFDDVIVATGIKPRVPDIPGLKESPKAAIYTDVVSGRVEPGTRVAIIGAGGIGFDTAEYLVHYDHVVPQGQEPDPDAPKPAEFASQWGVDMEHTHRGGLLPAGSPPDHGRTIYLLQRKSSKPGAGLGKTTGWAKRKMLADAGVHMMPSVQYKAVTDDGLVITDPSGKETTLEVDTVIICSGQISESWLKDTLEAAQVKTPDAAPAAVHLIGGAFKAAELDAKAAILQGTLLAAKL